MPLVPIIIKVVSTPPIKTDSYVKNLYQTHYGILEMILIWKLNIIYERMLFNATFNNISVISWQSVLLVEETRVPWENYRSDAIHWQTLSHNVVSSTPRMSGIQTHMLVVIGTDCIGSYKSNYMTMTAPTLNMNIWSYEKYKIDTINCYKFQNRVEIKTN